MSYEQDDPRDFLKRIGWTITLGFLWLMSTFAIGMYNNLMVPVKGIHLANIIFYCWMIGSLIALIWVNIRIWKKKFPHG